MASRLNTPSEGRLKPLSEELKPLSEDETAILIALGKKREALQKIESFTTEPNITAIIDELQQPIFKMCKEREYTELTEIFFSELLSNNNVTVDMLANYLEGFNFNNPALSKLSKIAGYSMLDPLDKTNIRDILLNSIEKYKATQDKATQDKATQDKATQDKATQDKATQDKATQDKLRKKIFYNGGNETVRKGKNETVRKGKNETVRKGKNKTVRKGKNKTVRKNKKSNKRRFGYKKYTGGEPITIVCTIFLVCMFIVISGYALSQK
jgi:hypothetical protein